MAAESEAFTYTEMREENLFTDAVIKSESGREWNVHKVVLSPLGRFFSTAFSYQSFTGTLDLGVRDNVVQALIDFAYDGSCVINVENVQEILRAALMYQLATLVKTCVTFVLDNMVTPEYAIPLKVFVRFHQEGLKTFADRDINDILDKFIRRNFIDIYERSDINELEFDEIESLVKEDDLNIPENELLHFVLEYVSFNRLDTRKALQLLANVRLDLINPANISQIANETPILGIEMERKDGSITHRPRWPRDIVIAPQSAIAMMQMAMMNPFVPPVTEIFNIRKNEWKPMEVSGKLLEMLIFGFLVGDIIYHFDVNSEDRRTITKAFDLASGRFLAEKVSQFPCDIGAGPVFQFVAWNGGIVATLPDTNTSPSIVAYYKPDENSWELFPSTRKHAVNVAVDGILLTLGGIDCVDENEEQGGLEGDDENGGNWDPGNKIEYYDSESKTWVLCGLFKSQPGMDTVVVEGKVYAFSVLHGYGECFQPVLTDGIVSLKWFPKIQIPFMKEPTSCQLAVVDNKILFVGGLQHTYGFEAEEREDDGSKECQIFSPKTGKWSRMSNLNVSKLYGRDFTIDASSLEVGRIEEICNGQIVMPDE